MWQKKNKRSKIVEGSSINPVDDNVLSELEKKQLTQILRTAIAKEAYMICDKPVPQEFGDNFTYILCST